MTGFRIQRDRPDAADVRALLEAHLALMRATSPPEDVHALDVDALLDQPVWFFSVRSEQGLLAVGALKHLDTAHAELKSMHTAAAARGRGVARALLEHLLGVARQQGYERVSLETGSTAEFAAAQRLYVAAGFAPCEPFADYAPSPHSLFLTLPLDPRAGA